MKKTIYPMTEEQKEERRLERNRRKTANAKLRGHKSHTAWLKSHKVEKPH